MCLGILGQRLIQFGPQDQDTVRSVVQIADYFDERAHFGLSLSLYKYALLRLGGRSRSDRLLRARILGNIAYCTTLLVGEDVGLRYGELALAELQLVSDPPFDVKLQITLDHAVNEAAVNAAKAESRINLLLDECASLFGEKSLEVAICQDVLGLCRQSLGDLKGAVDALRVSLSTTEAILGTKHEKTWTAKCNLANALCELGEYDEARDIFEAVRSHFRATPDSSYSPILSAVELRLAALHLQNGDYLSAWNSGLMAVLGSPADVDSDGFGEFAALVEMADQKLFESDDLSDFEPLEAELIRLAQERRW